jgi:hypothetical protein
VLWVGELDNTQREKEPQVGTLETLSSRTRMDWRHCEWQTWKPLCPTPRLPASCSTWTERPKPVWSGLDRPDPTPSTAHSSSVPRKQLRLFPCHGGLSGTPCSSETGPRPVLTKATSTPGPLPRLSPGPPPVEWSLSLMDTFPRRFTGDTLAKTV